MSKIIKVPDLGAEGAEVIEISVAVGDTVEVDDTIFIGETAKATMEVPTNFAGVIDEIFISVGDKVDSGTDMIKMRDIDAPTDNSTDGTESASEEPQEESSKDLEESKEDDPQGSKDKEQNIETESLAKEEPQKESSKTSLAEKGIEKWLAPVTQPERALTSSDEHIYAGPSVRKLARKLGVDLSKVQSPSGPKGRLTKNDIYDYVQNNIGKTPTNQQPACGLPELSIAEGPDVELVDLSKVQQISAKNLQRNATHIPHVTQFDKCDITDVNDFRKLVGADVLEQIGSKLTILPFIIKATTFALKDNPKLNASISNEMDKLYLKRYYNIGVAVNTNNGLLVPVVKNADKLSIREIALELSQLTEKAKTGRLHPSDMSDATFTISSLGAISGTGFTPIVNWPEVGILGVSPAKVEPVYLDGDFAPRLMLPLSLSYDHRAVDGVDAALFTKSLSLYLSDIRRMTL